MRTSIKISLCSKIPRRMLATVMAAMMMREPTRYPSAQASRMRPEESVGFPTSSLRLKDSCRDSYRGTTGMSKTPDLRCWCWLSVAEMHCARRGCRLLVTLTEVDDLGGGICGCKEAANRL